KQLGKLEGHSGIHRRVPADVRGVMAQSAQSKCQLVYVLCVVDQLHDKFAAAHIVKQITKKPLAGGIVAHVLNQPAPLGKGVGTAAIVFCRIGKTVQKEALDVTLPDKVNHLLVREHGVGS